MDNALETELARSFSAVVKNPQDSLYWSNLYAVQIYFKKLATCHFMSCYFRQQKSNTKSSEATQGAGEEEEGGREEEGGGEGEGE